MSDLGEAALVAEAPGGMSFAATRAARHGSELKDFWRLLKPIVMQLVIFTSADGIYRDPNDPSTIVPAVEGKNADEIIEQIDLLSDSCVGTSRAGSNGARAKLDFIKQPIREGTTVYIASAH